MVAERFAKMDQPIKWFGQITSSSTISLLAPKSPKVPKSKFFQTSNLLPGSALPQPVAVSPVQTRNSLYVRPSFHAYDSVHQWLCRSLYSNFRLPSDFGFLSNF